MDYPIFLLDRYDRSGIFEKVLNAVVSFMSGLIALRLYPFFPLSVTLLCIASLSLLLSRARKKGCKITLSVFMFLFALCYGLISNAEVQDIKLPEGEMVVEGTVTDVPETLGTKVRFTLSDVKVNGEEVQGRVRLIMFKEQFGDSAKELRLLPGQRVGALSVLKEPSVFRNYGVYSYDPRKDGIIAVGYVKFISTGGMAEKGSYFDRKRRRMGEIMDNSLSKESSGIHKAIVPGLKGGISPEMRDAFGAAGLAHLLSISGTHFGLLAFMIFRSVRRLLIALPSAFLARMTLYITPSQAAVIATLPVLLFYALVSGASIPTVRSLVMVVIYMLAMFLGRRGQWLNSLSIAALVILLWHPEALYELSFQLSFAAVLSIGHVLEARDKSSGESLKEENNGCLVGKVMEKLKTGVVMTVAAVAGTAPLTALAFKQFSFAAPVANLIVTPLVCFVILPLGFFTGFWALFLDLPAMPLSLFTDSLTGEVLQLVRFLADLPYASFRVHDPGAIMIACYYAALFLVFRRGLRRRAYWELGVLAAVMIWYAVTPCLGRTDLEITFLDVGQGEAVKVGLPDNKVMLIDGGPERPDTGRMVVAPYLWSRGIKRVDYLVLTHQHADHSGGLGYIVDNFDIGEVWLNGRPLHEAEGLLRKIKACGIPARALERGDMLNADGYSVQVLHPYGGFYAGSARGGFSDQNSDSLVMKIESRGLSFLFTGDIEEEAERDLIHLGKHLKSDVIKVPHHGGRTSSSAEFIKAVDPDMAVISAGRNNRFSHPHKETLQRYKAAGIKILRTDIDGAITISAGEDGRSVSTYRDAELKKAGTWRDEVRNLRLFMYGLD